MSGWIVRRAGFAGMVAVALVLTHNLVFLAAYGTGYADALARTGHDASWRIAILGVLALGAVLLMAAAWRLHALGVLARAAEVGPQCAPLGYRDLACHLLPLWLRLTLITTALLVLQENIERLGVGGPIPGLGVLVSGDYPNAGAIIAVVALGVALVGALFRWRRDVLVARIAAATFRWRPVTGCSVRSSLDGIACRLGSILGRRLAVRAPPGLRRL